MMERAFQLVKWLAKANPQGGWEYFLETKGGLRWDRVIMVRQPRTDRRRPPDSRFSSVWIE